MSKEEMVKLFCEMREGWLPDIGVVYTITLDGNQREEVIAALEAVRPEGVAIPCQKDGCQYGRLAVEKLLGPQDESK